MEGWRRKEALLNTLDVCPCGMNVFPVARVSFIDHRCRRQRLKNQHVENNLLQEWNIKLWLSRGRGNKHRFEFINLETIRY